MKPLPSGVSCKKVPFGNTFSYEFSHETLGSLGRIYFEELSTGNCIIKSEIVNSHSLDPNRQARARLFGKISEDINSVFDKTFGSGKLPEDYELKPRPDDNELIQSKKYQCERCGVPTHILINYPTASSEIDFIDVKRKMFGQLHQADLDTYVIGKENTFGDALIYKIWPSEKKIGHIAPEPFAELTGKFCKSCMN